MSLVRRHINFTSCQDKSLLKDIELVAKFRHQSVSSYLLAVLHYSKSRVESEKQHFLDHEDPGLIKQFIEELIK